MAGTVRVLIADDHAVVRHGLKSFLSTAPDIAAQLFIGERTVKSHVSSLLAKLELTDRTQLTIYAIRQGLVEA